MIFECIDSSLTKGYKKKIVSKIMMYNQNGIELLNIILSTTYTTTKLSAQTYKDELQALSFADHKYDIQQLHRAADDLTGKIGQSGSNMSDEDLIDHLFRAYKTSGNANFTQHITNLESQYISRTIFKSRELHVQVEAFIQCLKATKEWKPPAKPKGNGAG